MDFAQVAPIVEAYFRRAWTRWPSLGSHAGLAEFDGGLECPDAALHADQLRDVETTLSELNGLASCPDVSAESLDRQVFRSHLEWQRLECESLLEWRRNPLGPPEGAVGALYYLVTRRDLSNDTVADALLQRMERVPQYLAAARSAINDPVRMWLAPAQESTDGGVDFVRGCAAELSRLHPKSTSRIELAAEAAIQGLQSYREWLNGLQTAVLRDSPAIGADLLAQIVRINHGLPLTLDEIDAFGRLEVDRLTGELASVARTVDASRSWREIVADERARFAAQPHDLLSEYRNATVSLRDELRARNVMDLPPGECCDVVPTPAFLQPVIPSAAYSSPGPLDPNQKGIFYVSVPPSTPSRDACEADTAQHYGFESTCGHEAYPGHHVQLCWANRATSLARQMAHHIIFMEGWTLYCEHLLVELKFLDSPMWTIDCLQSQLWRAYRIVIDVGVQTGTMSVAEAVELLMREVGFTPARAHAELNWYTQSPGTPMSYLLGRHETLALRDRYRSRHPAASLRDFHHWLLRFGSIPQRWLVPYI